MKRHKLFMDPVYDEFILVERNSPLEKALSSRFLQRLRYVKQLGPCYMVYPGAEHTRFQHSLGVMWLVKKAVNYLRMKDFRIDPDTELILSLTALLHDVGHSPYSHALEGHILNSNHEEMTLFALKLMVEEGSIEEALASGVASIMKKEHPLPFTYQLISSQLDCDRLDYLRRDAFYTGVSFGKIDVNRILISALIENGELVWSFKGFNALEAYVMSRYEMYWAVYFHKVNLSAQVLLQKIVKRIKFLISDGSEVPCDPTLKKVLKEGDEENFFRLTDGNITASIYSLTNASDSILSDLCNRFVRRRLFRTVEVKPAEVLELAERVKEKGYDPSYYFEIVEPSKVAYTYYSPSPTDVIKVKTERGTEELSKVAPTDAIKALSREVTKVYAVLPEEVLE
ncbi:MAG: HD domain-containing protein [Desulfurobacteriaceae bacterium]